MIKIYTDGSCKGNGKENSYGGWGYVIVNKENEILFDNSNYEEDTTNNRMEMVGFINGIRKALEIEPVEIIEVFTDSAYIHNCLQQKWYVNWRKNDWHTSKNTPVKNKELWIEILDLIENNNIKATKVKGHDGDHWNEYVDDLAQGAAEKGRNK